MVRLALLVAALLAASIGPGAADEHRPPAEIRVEVVDGGRPPTPQEMVIVRVHGRYHVPVTLEKMATPDMPGLRAVRVGRDRWYEAFEQGLTVRAFERTYAVHPQRSGRIVIPPFVHQLTILDARMQHQEVAVASAPVEIDVRPAPVEDGTWWLPASGLEVEERWTVAPEELGIGQSTRRSLTIRAFGVYDDQLPPPPPMRADGLIIFPAETTRWTKVGLAEPADRAIPLRERALRKPELYETVAEAPLGPLSEVTYAWDVRPATDQPRVLPEIRIPWYDTASGRMREVVIPERTVAYAILGPDTEKLERTLGITGEAPAAERDPFAPVATAGAGLAAFLATLAVLMVAAEPGLPRRLREASRIRAARRAAAVAARRAARRGDAGALREALLAHRRAGGDAGAADEGVRALDRHLYGGGPSPDLAALARRATARSA